MAPTSLLIVEVELLTWLTGNHVTQGCSPIFICIYWFWSHSPGSSQRSLFPSGGETHLSAG